MVKVCRGVFDEFEYAVIAIGFQLSFPLVKSSRISSMCIMQPTSLFWALLHFMSTVYFFKES